eukprot:6214338-Pleurochrysis_carterae.AAC.2
MARQVRGMRGADIPTALRLAVQDGAFGRAQVRGVSVRQHHLLVAAAAARPRRVTTSLCYSPVYHR